MASSSQYGVTAPAGSDPYPIESTLSQLAFKENPVEAANMLDVYRSMNEANTGNYNYALNQQHQYAYDQLAAQLHEQNLKALQEGYKTPGLLGAYASAPQYQGIVAGIDPNQMQSASTNLAHAQAVESAQKGGAAAASLTQAGAQPGQEGMDYLSGGTAGKVGTPEGITIAQLKLQGDLARAAARKAGDQMMTIPYKFGEDKAGNAITGPVKVRVGASDAEIAAAAANAGRIYSGFYPQGTGLPGSVGPAAGGNVNAGPDQSRPPPPPRTQTSLPMAQQDTGKSGTTANTTTTRATPQPQAASKQFILDAKTQQQAQAGLKVLPPDAKRDVAANIQGAVVPIVPLVGGGVGYVGKSGTIHTLPR